MIACMVASLFSVTTVVAACTFAMLTDLSVVGEQLAGGFGVAGDEPVNGVMATHFHSDAGSMADLRSGVDAGTDLWVADDGGYLVRLAVAGSLPLQVDVSRVGDRRNRVVHP